MLHMKNFENKSVKYTKHLNEKCPIYYIHGLIKKI